MSIRNHIIEFEIPCHIQVENSFKDNKHSRFYPVIEDVPVEIRFKSYADDSRGVSVAGTAAGDRHGSMGNSSVQVWFDDSFIQKIPDDIDDELPIEAEPVFQMGSPKGKDRILIESAVEYLNKFLRAYRSSTSFYWITTLSVHEISRFSIADIYENESTEHRTKFITQGAVKFGSMDDDVLNRVRHAIQMESPISIYNELDLNAEDKIDRGDFNSAIIDSATLFESWIKDAFEIIACEQGNSEEEAREMITKGDDSGDYLSPKNIALAHIPKLGFDFEGTTEFDIWDKNTREIRNKVVHEGYQADATEARRSKNSAVLAMIKISNEFSEELDGSVAFVQEASKNHLY